MKTGTRSLKKYVIFPCCLLVFGVVEKIVEYKLAEIPNDHLRVAAGMFLYAFGISLIAFLVTPLMERLVLRMHVASRTGGGSVGELVFVALLVATVYLLWYVVTLDGPHALLPLGWR